MEAKGFSSVCAEVCPTRGDLTLIIHDGYRCACGTGVGHVQCVGGRHSHLAYIFLRALSTKYYVNI